MNSIIDEIKFDPIREQAYDTFVARIQQGSDTHQFALDTANSIYDIIESPRKATMQEMRGYDEPSI